MTKLTASALAHFTGTTQWYSHPLFKGYSYTDGVRYMAETGEAYWLIDAIFSHQCRASVRSEDHQLWKLVTSYRMDGLLTATSYDGQEIARQRMEYSSFPLSEIVLLLKDKILLLPSEN